MREVGFEADSSDSEESASNPTSRCSELGPKDRRSELRASSPRAHVRDSPSHVRLIIAYNLYELNYRYLDGDDRTITMDT